MVHLRLWCSKLDSELPWLAEAVVRFVRDLERRAALAWVVTVAGMASFSFLSFDFCCEMCCELGFCDETLEG